MTAFDVFNGDADGICALQQLRLADPIDTVLVTGVKRDIELLARVEAGRADEVTVLDISLDKNRDGLERILARGARVRYFDHHFAGTIPQHANLEATIDASPDICTSLLVNQHLNNKFLAWAVVGAFGDNFEQRAHEAARPLGLGTQELGQLRELGILINYNAYGRTVEDLYFAPDELAQRLRPYQDPLALIAQDDAFQRLRDGYANDMEKAQQVQPELASEKCAVYVLPGSKWANRVSGVFANHLAQGAPARAHALLTGLPHGGYVVSVRAPLSNPQGADALCRQFPTGGGRKAAAGINHLPEPLYADFITQFRAAYG